ncbi:MAG: adenylosuccinate synthase [Lentisphaeria bacterium]|nr:adenylosuccinate synthase [Lentisphaeria bacterium]
MPTTVLVGLQWGDEGKGKIIDFLTERSDLVVRFQGGNNAGHTVEIGKEQFILHLIPSGILRQGTLNVIANGVVVNPLALCHEIDELQRRGVDVLQRLRLSSRCHLLFTYHGMMDSFREAQLGEGKIGTTKRGIGPAYADKASRVGIRACVLRDVARFETLFRARAEFYNHLFTNAEVGTLEVENEWEKLRQAASVLAPLVEDTALLVNRAAAAGKSILMEGAQGTWLDVDFGTYPFVTSSNTIAGAACTGTGLAPHRIDRVTGVVKAYTTRVGSGPFPTELSDATGDALRRRGSEYGATTGRPRRCGWFDAVATRYAAMLNGADGAALTKLDVLDGFESVRICTAYELDGRVVTDMPTDGEEIARVRPRYEEMPGWLADTTSATTYEDLPEAARAYIRRLMELTGMRLEIVSVGPRRDQTFSVGD